MHLLVRETQSLDEQAPAEDLGQSPADLVFLSFSDADLGALAAAWQAMAGRVGAGAGPLPSVRLASLARLRHPMSVDLYAEQVIARARCVVIRLLGGLDYWRYGVEECAAVCRRHAIALVVVPGDGGQDAQLAALSSVGAAQYQRMDGFLRHGGPANLGHALVLAAALAGRGADDQAAPKPLPAAGVLDIAIPTDGPLAVIVCYRSHVLSGDIAPVHALAAALAARGMAVRALYVSSLKDPAAAGFVARQLREWQPVVVLNATNFSAWSDAAGGTLEASGAPVLQLVMAVSSREAWLGGFRGLSQTDMAMQVVLPELDGRLLTTAIAFKAAEPPVGGLEFGRTINRPDADGIALASDRAAGWVLLAGTPPVQRRLALVLSDYPGVAGQTGHAVGLDSFASAAAILRRLAAAGYRSAVDVPDAAALVAALTGAAPRGFMTLAAYRACFVALPQAVQDDVCRAWGAPEDDPAIRDGGFACRYFASGEVVLAVQPERGHVLDRKAGYHDADLPPRHAYVAFYLWLRLERAVHAVIHLGTHGTLEWLPGKAVALSDDCLPTALLRGLPVIYPFIVNNPGEAAAAKRRLGAVTIGHLTPPIMAASAHGAAGELERLIDEYATADGLDRRRGALLRRSILQLADEAGLLAESGADRSGSDDAALARLDAYLCDVKALQIRDGLHVFGAPPTGRAPLLDAIGRAAPHLAKSELAARLDACAEAEAAALLGALDGRFVQPGPAGAPTRGRADVLPTGRNLFTIDPRAVPTQAALALAERAAADLLTRHLQDHGEALRRIVIDLWGSASMRTGGEDLALALVLMGVRPTWDAGSARVNGFEILPLAVLDRTRVDVTLRISGLFRDTFETQIALFDAAARALAARDEAADWNPLAGTADPARIFGAPQGAYGAGVAPLLDRGGWADRAALGRAYLAASSTAYGADGSATADSPGFAARVAAAEAFLHQQDHAETDLLDSVDYAAHEGGFAAAADLLGATPALYHGDTSQPETPRTRTLGEEIARVVRGRAANPAWIAGMMRHGYRGAAEITRALEALHGFAATVPLRLDRQFDLVFEATLGDVAVDAFLAAANPAARAAMVARFQEAMARDLWRPHRNAIGQMLMPPAGAVG